MPEATDLPDYSDFSHPLVRDLCWTLSPAFDLLGDLSPFHRFVPTQSSSVLRKWLAELQQHPQGLEAFIDEHSPRRLGHYFERLILFYFSHAPEDELQVLDHNCRIYAYNADGGRTTVGELDFLLTGAAGTVHLETAVKFFLGVEHAGEVRWVGPALQDRLDRKLQHLRNHQLPLSQRLEKSLAAPIQRYFWVKGILFQPWGQQLDIADGLLVPASENRWLTCSQAMECTFEGEWMCLPKSRWLGCSIDDEQQRVDREYIARHFAGTNRVLMMTHTRSASRRVIVPNEWPAAAHAALLDRNEAP